MLIKQYKHCKTDKKLVNAVTNRGPDKFDDRVVKIIKKKYKT